MARNVWFCVDSLESRPESPVPFKKTLKESLIDGCPLCDHAISQSQVLMPDTQTLTHPTLPFGKTFTTTSVIEDALIWNGTTGGISIHWCFTWINGSNFGVPTIIENHGIQNFCCGFDFFSEESYSKSGFTSNFFSYLTNPNNI